MRLSYNFIILIFSTTILSDCKGSDFLTIITIQI